MSERLRRFLVSLLLPGQVAVNRSQIVAIRRLARAAMEFLRGIIEVCDEMLA